MRENKSEEKDGLTWTSTACMSTDSAGSALLLSSNAILSLCSEHASNQIGVKQRLSLGDGRKNGLGSETIERNRCEQEIGVSTERTWEDLLQTGHQTFALGHRFNLLTHFHAVRT